MLTGEPLLPSGQELPRFTYFRGRVALASILRALGIRPGDHVALQAFTCVAVPEGIVAAGAKPLWVDVARRSYTIDPEDLRRRLTPQVRAIVVQHTFGIPSDLTRVLAIAQERHLPVIEDCAHALGSLWRGRPVGTWGDAAFFSFEAGKPVFAGIGGAAVAASRAVTQEIQRDHAALSEPSLFTQAQLLAMWIAHAMFYRPSTYWTVRRVFRAFVAAGLVRGNYNDVDPAAAPARDFELTMGPVQRAVLRRGLRDLSGLIAHRRRVAAEVLQRVHNPSLTIPSPSPDADPVYARLPFLAEDRAALLAAAAAARVELAQFYSTPVHPLRGVGLAKLGYDSGSCPNAEWVADRVVSLPTGRGMGGSSLERAVALLNGSW
jgi:dTDP-4-amino-4,6-dideoxygalactose transaminase